MQTCVRKRSRNADWLSAQENYSDYTIYENIHRPLARRQRPTSGRLLPGGELAREAVRSQYDAIVIGGGPSGSAYGITLARSGFSVLVLEREKFPRFHIGEEFLPYTLDVLDQMGILSKFTNEGFVIKRGLEIIASEGVRAVDLDVTGHDGYRTWAWQVERARFDEILLGAAAQEPGTTVLQQAKVNHLIFSGERVAGVHYQRNGEQYLATARLVVDASGRAGVVARALGLRRTDGELKMAAVYKHFAGFDEENNPSRPGDSQIGVHSDGWVWAIPIREDVISIGTVAPANILRASRPEEMFVAHLNRVPRIRQRIKGAGEWRGLSGESNFEYHSDKLAGPGFLLVGDAGCFIDPVFSAGVYLALATGRRAAEESARFLSGDVPESVAAMRYQNFYKTGYDTYYRLIRSVYDRSLGAMGKTMETLFREESVGERERVLALSGDLWSGTNPFLVRVRKEKNWGLFGHFDPLYGCPVYGRE